MTTRKLYNLLRNWERRRNKAIRRVNQIKAKIKRKEIE